VQTAENGCTDREMLKMHRYLYADVADCRSVAERYGISREACETNIALQSQMRTAAAQDAGYF